MTSKLVTVACLIGCTGAMAVPAHSQDRCGAVLANGLWNESITDSGTDTREAFYNYLRSNHVDARSTSVDGSGKALVPIPGSPVPVPVEGFVDVDDARHSVSAVERRTFNYIDRQEWFRNLQSSASEIIVRAWESCINSPGLKFYARTTSTSGQYVIRAKFEDLPGGATQTAVDLNVPAQGVRCSGPLMNVTTLDDAWREAACMVTGSASSLLTLSANPGGDMTIELAPPAPEVKPVILGAITFAAEFGTSPDNPSAHGTLDLVLETTSGRRTFLLSGPSVTDARTLPSRFELNPVLDVDRLERVSLVFRSPGANNADCLALKNIRVGFDSADGGGGELAYLPSNTLLVVNPSVANCRPAGRSRVDIPIIY